MDRKSLFKHLAVLIFLIFLVNFFANKFYWYYTIWYFDMIMHFLGGFWVGLLALYLFTSPKASILSFDSVLRILAFVLFIGVSWEIFEVLVDKVVSRYPFNILDTTSDLFFDMAGSVFAILYFLKRVIPSSENKIQSS